MSNAALDMCPRYRLTVRDYHRMGEAGILHQDSRVELIEGDLIAMSPIGSAHAGTVLQLSSLFKDALGRRALVSVQNPIILGEHSEPEPDLMLLRLREDFYKSAHPRPEDVLLLVEVSDTTLRYDYEVKVPLYARHGIPEVWLVDLENKRLRMLYSPSEQGYQEEKMPDLLVSVSPQCLPDITFNLSGLFS